MSAREDAERYYAAKKAKNAAVAAARIEELMLVPEYARMISERNKLRADCFRAAAEGVRVEETQKELNSFVQRMPEIQKKILADKGYPENYLDPLYDCPKCYDTGYIGRYKKIPCECFRARLPKHALGGLEGMPTFADFDISIFGQGEPAESAKRLVEACRKYADDFPNNERRNIVMLSKPGRGKSFMLSCIASRIKERGYTARLMTAYRLHEFFRKEQFGDGNMINVLINTDFLVIDDLGTEPMHNNFTCEYLFTLLNERSVQKKNTAIATNLSDAGIMERYGDRLYSRIFDSSSTRVMRLNGADLRKNK